MSSLVDRIKRFIEVRCLDVAVPPANAAGIAQAEADLGFGLPPLLRECYLEIANGGFGPGRGVMGVDAGHCSDYGNIVATYKMLERDHREMGKTWEAGLLPFCGWGLRNPVVRQV